MVGQLMAFGVCILPLNDQALQQIGASPQLRAACARLAGEMMAAAQAIRSAANQKAKEDRL